MNKEQMIEKIMKDMKQYLYEFDAEILSKSLNKHLQDLESINEENKEVENDKHTCGSIDPNATFCDICGLETSRIE